MRRLLLSAVAIVSAAVACERTPISPSGPGFRTAAALVDVTAGSVGTDNFPGQSVSVPAGVYESLRFSWYSFAHQPTAFGTLYLLSSEYHGAPSSLSGAIGLIAKSVAIRDGEYVFPDGLWITGGRRYWFLCDKSGSYLHSFDIDVYPDGDSYHTGISSSPFGKSQASGHYISFNPPVFVQAPPDLYIDTNFRLRGRAITR